MSLHSFICQEVFAGMHVRGMQIFLSAVPASKLAGICRRGEAADTDLRMSKSPV